MTTPWPNAAYVSAVTADPLDNPAAQVTPEAIAAAHLYIAKNQLSSIAMLSGLTLGQFSHVIDPFTHGSNQLFGESVAVPLSWAVGTGIILSFAIFFFLLAKTDFSIDNSEQYRIASTSSVPTKRNAFHVAMPIILLFVWLIGYFGAGWLEKNNRVPDGFGELAQAFLCLTLVAFLGWNTRWHFKRAKDQRAAL